MTIRKIFPALIFGIFLILSGCSGGSTGGSSEEGAVVAKENPVLGTWQVSIDPQNAKIEIVPVTLGANSLEPLYSWTNQVVITAMVNRAMATETPALTATDWANLGFGHLVPGSERVMNNGVKCTKGIEYNIQYYNGKDGAGALARTGVAGTCNIASGETVTISYGYGGSRNITWVSPDFTMDIAVENHLNATLEKVRFWTGETSGPGAPQNPTIAAGYAEYPLLQPQVGSTYGKPAIGPAPVDGWTSGICYTSWGHWNSTSAPAVEGCTLITHPKGGVQYAPGWMDPVCGRVINTFQFTGATNPYNFYMQLTGTVNAWNPNYTAAPGGADPRFDKVNYSTWYALMGYLVPDTAGMINTWCSATAGGQRYWWQGSLIPDRPGLSRHCATLITDPHLTRGTYFSVNFGIEYADTIEKQAKTFWDAYKTGGMNPDVKLGVGAPYMQTAAMGVIFDQNALTGFLVAGRTGHGGSTQFPGGFAQQYTTNYNANDSAGFKKLVGGFTRVSGIGSPTYNITAPIGYIISAQFMGNAYVTTNFIFFTITGLTTTNPYVTQLAGNVIYPALSMPAWAGQWGVAHWEKAGGSHDPGNFVTEGADADLDYWQGMIILKVKTTAIAGDYGFIRFDQTGNNFLNWYYNNQDASNHPSHLGGATEDLSSTYCVAAGGAMQACPAAPSPTWSIWHAVEYPNPALPPGNSKAASAYATGCPQGGGADYSCGGHQYVTAVVCVQ